VLRQLCRKRAQAAGIPHEEPRRIVGINLNMSTSTLDVQSRADASARGVLNCRSPEGGSSARSAAVWTCGRSRRWPLCNPEQVTGAARHYSGEVMKLRAAVSRSFAVPTEYLSLHKHLQSRSWTRASRTAKANFLARNVVFERAAA
jgi:hypothetical protein